MKKNRDNQILTTVPRDFVRAPLFAATKQPEGQSRTIIVGDRRYIIGGFHPVHSTRKPPALDIRHGRAVFTLLSFRKPGTLDRSVRFSMNEFCKRYAHANGGKYSRYIRDILGDLMDTYFGVFYGDDPNMHSFRILEYIHTIGKPIRRKDAKRATNDLQQEIWFEEVRIDEQFNALVNRISELAQLRLDVLNNLTSHLAQAIYCFIPSRSHHHNESNPFEISLTTLLTQVSHPVPKYKSKRKQLFTQNDMSIVAQLDGAETLSGTLRAQIVETKDKADFKLLTWVDRKQPLPPVSKDKLYTAWSQSGRSIENFSERTKTLPILSTYDTDLLEAGHVEVDGNVRFFRKAKALLGESEFSALLAESKGDFLEGIPTRKTPTARLIYRIMEALKSK